MVEGGVGGRREGVGAGRGGEKRVEIRLRRRVVDRRKKRMRK